MTTMTMTMMTTMITTIESNRERSSSTRTRLNKSVLTPTILRTAIAVITQAARTRIYNLQSSRSFVLDIFAVLRCPMKTMTTVKAREVSGQPGFKYILAVPD
jgi:hypothetical protein